MKTLKIKLFSFLIEWQYLFSLLIFNFQKADITVLMIMNCFYENFALSLQKKNFTQSFGCLKIAGQIRGYCQKTKFYHVGKIGKLLLHAKGRNCKGTLAGKESLVNSKNSISGPILKRTTNPQNFSCTCAARDEKKNV